MIDAVNPRVELPAGLVETRAIVLLPGCTLDEAVAPVEVLIEEGLPILSLSPGQRLTPSMLRRVFGRRLLVGTHDLRTPADAQWAVSEQAAFALTLGDDDQLRSELAAAQIPQCPAALTPTEIANAWKQPDAAAVQVVPAGVLGTGYPAQLAALLPDIAVLARGAESVHEVKAWLGAGAVAVCLADRLIGDALHRGDLSALRSRARPIVEATRTRS